MYIIVLHNHAPAGCSGGSAPFLHLQPLPHSELIQHCQDLSYITAKVFSRPPHLTSNSICRCPERHRPQRPARRPRRGSAAAWRPRRRCRCRLTGARNSPAQLNCRWSWLPTMIAAMEMSAVKTPVAEAAAAPASMAVQCRASTAAAGTAWRHETAARRQTRRARTPAARQASVRTAARAAAAGRIHGSLQRRRTHL